MAVSVRFHQEDPWERLRLVSAAMPNTPLGMITTGHALHLLGAGRRGRDGARRSGCVVRNGIRRFQIADPSNDPERLRQLAAMARARGDRGGRGRADLLDQPGAHPRLLRRSAPPRSPTARTWTGSTSRTRAGCSRPTRCASWRRTSSPRPPGGRRAAQPLHDRAGAAGLHGGRPRRFQVVHTACGAARRAGPRSRRSSNTVAQPRGGRLRARARPRGAGGRDRALRPSSPPPRGCRPARRRSSTPPTTATSSPAGW